MRHNSGRIIIAALAALLPLAAGVAACSPAVAPALVSTKASQADSQTTEASKAGAVRPPDSPAEQPSAAPGSAPPSTPTGRPIKLGFITPLTGRAAGYGARQKIPVQLALEDINNAGGINGSPLEIVMVDDGANPREDAILVQRLANEDKVLAIVGPLTSASFEVAAPIANELNVPLATATSTKPGVTDENRPWIFRFGTLDATVTPKAVEGYRKLYPNVKKMVIAGDAKESVNEHIIVNIYPRALADAGLEVAGTVSFETGTTDFSAIVAKVKSLNPDGIAYSSLTPEAVGIAKELQRQGVKAPVVASLQNWGGPEIVLAPEAIEGWVGGGTFDEDTPDPRGIAYLERFVEIGEADPGVGKPAYSSIWTQTYDTVMVLAEAMRRAGVTPDTDIQKARTAIQESVHTLRGFQGITGEISVQPNGDIITAPLAFVAKGGKWVLIK